MRYINSKINFLIIILCFLLFFVLFLFLVTDWENVLIFNNNYNTYSFILLSLSLTISIILYKKEGISVSLVLYYIFIIFSFFGVLSNYLYKRIFGLYHGQYHLNSSFPMFIWQLGTLFLLIGIIISKSTFNYKPKIHIKWNFKFLKFILYFFSIIASISTLIAILKIGYIPIFRGSIDNVRSSFEVGDYIFMLSRFWIFTGIISTFLYFMESKRILYLIILIISLFSLTIYGQRIFVLTVLAASLFIYFKFRKINIKVLVFLLLAFTFMITYPVIRSNIRTNKSVFMERSISMIGGVWEEYSIITNEVKDTQNYYGNELYTGAIATFLPKQIWSVFGIDKDYLIENYTANHIFGKRFGDEIGIRITTIGEAYAAHGILFGVCLQMFFWGYLFAILDKLYEKFPGNDARLILIVFLLSLLIYLHEATLYITIAHAKFYGLIFFGIILISSNFFNVIIMRHSYSSRNISH